MSKYSLNAYVIVKIDDKWFFSRIIKIINEKTYQIVIFKINKKIECNEESLFFANLDNLKKYKVEPFLRGELINNKFCKIFIFENFQKLLKIDYEKYKNGFIIEYPVKNSLFDIFTMYKEWVIKNKLFSNEEEVFEVICGFLRYAKVFFNQILYSKELIHLKRNGILKENEICLNDSLKDDNKNIKKNIRALDDVKDVIEDVNEDLGNLKYSLKPKNHENDLKPKSHEKDLKAKSHESDIKDGIKNFKDDIKNIKDVKDDSNIKINSEFSIKTRGSSDLINDLKRVKKSGQNDKKNEALTTNHNKEIEPYFNMENFNLNENDYIKKYVLNHPLYSNIGNILGPYHLLRLIFILQECIIPKNNEYEVTEIQIEYLLYLSDFLLFNYEKFFDQKYQKYDCE
ncbi:hypothetical protein DMUE_5386 [Dictyocoela muelleri]|nr:hypothetical protein DMUE_5386 [Dictyocoela muelleri]